MSRLLAAALDGRAKPPILRETPGLSTLFRVPPIDLGAPSVRRMVAGARVASARSGSRLGAQDVQRDSDRPRALDPRRLGRAGGSLYQGLLGAPEMQVRGNGSSSDTLRWFTDRSAGVLPSPWIVSVPILGYRAAMLGWALWIALALLRWLRWDWDAFTAGEGWRKKPPKPLLPPVPFFPQPMPRPMPDPGRRPGA